MSIVTVAGDLPVLNSFVIGYENMEPYLRPNDTVTTSSSTLFDNLIVGDTIAFKIQKDKTLSIQVEFKNKENSQRFQEGFEYEPYSLIINKNNEFCRAGESDDRVIVSRVAEIGKFFGVRVLRAQGDANPYSVPEIDYPIFKENYIGKVVSITHNTTANIINQNLLKTYVNPTREFVTDKKGLQCTYNISDGRLRLNEFLPNQWVFDGTLKSTVEEGTTTTTKIFPFIAYLSITQVTETPTNSTQLIDGRMGFGNILSDFKYQNVNGSLTIQDQEASLNLSANKEIND